MDSRFGDLAYSSDGGRVVVVSAEGATQNFDKLVSQLNAEKQRQVQELDKRYAKALDVLKGE